MIRLLLMIGLVFWPLERKRGRVKAGGGAGGSGRRNREGYRNGILMSHTGRDLLRNFPAGRRGQVCI